MRKFLLLSICALYLVPCTFSQAPQSWTSAEMYQAIEKLNVLGSVLYVAAHPDDENTRLISYLSKDRLFRAGYLSMTRGDGGQNLIGDEQGVELGLIRTQELMAARRVDGGEQFFTRAFDFGYSKNPEETFTKWDKEKILSDVVWVIRKFQPDVIVTRFPTTGEGGHGHHTASAILANEAFTAAADPNRFPEQLKYVKTWQVKRILWNTFNFGGNNTQRDDQLKIDVGGYNPLLGKSYGEIAAESRTNHKSQGFGSSGSRGEAMEFFSTTKGDAPKIDLMDDVDISWKKVKGGITIGKMVNDLKYSFDLLHPERSVEGLVKLYKAIAALEDGYWKNQKLKEVKELIAQCSGLFLDATTATQYAVQTDSVRINFSFNNRMGADIQLQKVIVNGFDSSFSMPMEKNKNINFAKTFYVPADKPITQPYWLANKMEEGYFNVTDLQKIGQPDVDPAYEALIQVKLYGESFTYTKPVKYRHNDPVKGELYEPLIVIPIIFLKPTPQLVISGLKANGIMSYNLLVSSNKKSDRFSLSGDSMDVAIYRGGINKAENISFTISDTFGIKIKNLTRYRDTTHYSYNYDNVTYYKYNNIAYDLKSIKYDHVPSIQYFKESEIVRNYFEYETYNKKIGYIIGAGDKVPDALEQMGYEVTLLTDKELSRNNLSQFDAIITGVRAYNTNDWMNGYYDKLMKYVNDGGNLIVQYNTSNFISNVPFKMGPYNFNISRTRVTDENAVVTFLRPEHPVLNFPNKITQDDFKGWVQERSIYHASNWDKEKFETIFSMNDPGEKADEGSLIISQYGKGYFTYTGLVFFRELPAGVPGAYRLLANIIALNKKKAF